MDEEESEKTGCGLLWQLGLGIFGVAALLSLCLVLFTAGTDADSNPMALDACYMAQEFVKRELRAPASAKFGSAYDDCAALPGEANEWLVASHVDAQNGFGAMLRSNYVVQMRYNPDRDTWSLLGVEFGE